MKYICLVYNEPDKLDALSESEFVEHVGQCSSWVQDLNRSGRHIYSAGLQSSRTAVTIRARSGTISITDGPFAETKEVFGGFTIIEARDFNEAIQIASKLDCVRIGSVEVRPVLEPDLDMDCPLDRKIAAAIRSVAMI